MSTPITQIAKEISRLMLQMGNEIDRIQSLAEAAQAPVQEPSKRRPEKDACKRIPCSYAALRERRYSGTGPKYIRIGGRIYYDDADVDAWIAAGKAKKLVR